MPELDSRNPSRLSLLDLPRGWGPGKVVEAERLAEPEGAIHVGYDNTTSGLVASDVQAAIDELAGSLGASSVFVLDPAGVADGNVYLDWATLYAALPAAGAPRAGVRIVFMASVTIPVGTYDLGGMSLAGVPVTTGFDVAPVVTFADGCVLTALPEVLWNITLLTLSTAAPLVTIGAATPTVLTGFSACLTAEDVQPFALFDGAGNDHQFIFYGSGFSGSNLFNDGGALGCIVLANGSNASITLYGDAYIGTDTLANDVTSQFQIKAAGGAEFMDTVQTNASGLGINMTSRVADTGANRRSVPQRSSFAITNNLLIPVALKNDTTTYTPGNDWGPLAEVAASLGGQGVVSPSNNSFVGSGIIGATGITAAAVTTVVNTTLGVYGQCTTGAVIGDEAGWAATLGTQTFASGGVHFFRFAVPETTAFRAFVGLSDQFGALRGNATASDTPAGTYVGVQFFTTRGDTTYRLVVRNAAGTQVLSGALTNALPSVQGIGFLLMIDLRNQPSAGTGTLVMRLWRWDTSQFVNCIESGSTDYKFSVASTTGAWTNLGTTELAPMASITTTAGVAKSIRTAFAQVNPGFHREML